MVEGPNPETETEGEAKAAAKAAARAAALKPLRDARKEENDVIDSLWLAALEAVDESPARLNQEHIRSVLDRQRAIRQLTPDDAAAEDAGAIDLAIRRLVESMGLTPVGRDEWQAYLKQVFQDWPPESRYK